MQKITLMKLRNFFQFPLILLLLNFFYSCSDNNEPKKIEETTIFTTKYTNEKVWDAFRSPAYPIVNEDWELYNFKGALDPDGGYIEWGTGRYLQFVAVVDNTNSSYSITDDLYNTGTKYTIMLKLYESDGTLVKVVSEYGQIIGIGEKGFMYEAENYYGMFFPVGIITSTDNIIYKPTTATVTKLSELYR